jgi:hypothetical protein
MQQGGSLLRHMQPTHGPVRASLSPSLPPPRKQTHLESSLGALPGGCPHVVGHAHHVCGIQRGVHLVQHKEGGGLEAAAGRGRCRVQCIGRVGCGAKRPAFSASRGAQRC